MYYKGIFIEGWGWITEKCPDDTGLFNTITTENLVNSIEASDYETDIRIEFAGGEIFSIPREFIKAYRRFTG